MIKISAKYKNSFIAVSLIAVFILLFSFASYQKKDTLSTSLINKEIILKESIFLAKKFVLDYSINDFIIEFSSMHFASPTKNNFVYKVISF